MAEQRTIPSESLLDEDSLVSAAWSPLAIQATLDRWAEATTRQESLKREALLAVKTNAVIELLAFVRKPPGAVTPEDLQRWQTALAQKPVAKSTIYKLVSFVSSFYRWALDDPQLAQYIRMNPVTLARPKNAKPYQGEQTKALDDDDLARLVEVVRRHAADPKVDVVAKRDYALLLFYLLSGMRREEVVGLHWKDIKIRKDGGIVLGSRVKGGDYVTRIIASPAVSQALLDYLEASGRRSTMEPETPLWVAHDRAQKIAPKSQDGGRQRALVRTPGDPLDSRGFVNRLKRYAKEAGLGPIHLHQTRHTYARLISQRAAHLGEVQAALRHKNLATTRVYVERVSVLEDKFSHGLAHDLGLTDVPHNPGDD